MSEVSVSKLAIVAVVAGVCAAVGTMFFLSEVEEKYRLAAEPEPVKMITIIVPRINLARGDRLERDLLAARSIPLEYAPANVLQAKDIESVVDRTLLADVNTGLPMTWLAVTSTKARNFADVVEIGRRARTMRVSEVDSIDGLLRPGDRIDLMGTFELSDLGYTETQGGASSMPDDALIAVLENVEVIESSRVDKNGRRYTYNTDKNSKDGIDMEFTLLTLNLRPRQIARLELAERTGSLFAVLRNPNDTGTTEFEYLGLDILLTKDSPPSVDLVLGVDGKPIGRIVGDQVVDADGNVIGEVIDGKAVAFSGESLGSIAKNISADDPINRVKEVADVVRDANGNVIGRIVDGQVIDRSGNVIGTVENGKAVSLSGASLGEIAENVSLDANGREVNLEKSTVKRDLVLGSDGKPVGTIVGDQVLDAQGKIVGKIVDGKAVALDGTALGEVRRNVSIDDPIFQVAEIATVVRDSSGRIVGKVVDGNVLDAEGNVIGLVDERGRAVSSDGTVLGSLESGVALDANGLELELTEKETVVRNAQGEVIGSLVDGKVIDASGKEIGTYQNGMVVSASGEVLATGVTASKETLVRNAQGEVIGSLVDGKVIDASGEEIGTYQNGIVVSASGEVLATGVTIGRIDTEGLVDADTAPTSIRSSLVDFVAGGTAEEGITPVVKVSLQ